MVAGAYSEITQVCSTIQWVNGWIGFTQIDVVAVAPYVSGLMGVPDENGSHAVFPYLWIIVSSIH